MQLCLRNIEIGEGLAALEWATGGYTPRLGKDIIKVTSEMNSLTIKTWV